MLLCDGGGSNASNRHVFKEALQKLAERLGLDYGLRAGGRRVAPGHGEVHRRRCLEVLATC